MDSSVTSMSRREAYVRVDLLPTEDLEEQGKCMSPAAAPDDEDAFMREFV